MDGDDLGPGFVTGITGFVDGDDLGAGSELLDFGGGL